MSIDDDELSVTNSLSLSFCFYRFLITLACTRPDVLDAYILLRWTSYMCTLFSLLMHTGRYSVYSRTIPYTLYLSLLLAAAAFRKPVPFSRSVCTHSLSFARPHARACVCSCSCIYVHTHIAASIRARASWPYQCYDVER